MIKLEPSEAFIFDWPKTHVQIQQSNLYKIKKGVPIPKVGAVVNKPKEYQKDQFPFSVMEVGDMFECENPRDAQRATQLASHRYGPGQFAARKLPNGNSGVWRISKDPATTIKLKISRRAIK